MNKIIGFLIGICAFFIALFYVLNKKNFMPVFTKDTHFLKRRFLTIVTVIIALLSGDKAYPVADEVSLPTNSTTIKQDRGQINMEKTNEWKHFKKRWGNLKNTTSWPTVDIAKEVKKEKEINNKYLAMLISKSYISEDVAYILNYVYGELLFHRLRSTSGWTCYKMTQLGGSMAGVRKDLENRLNLLRGISGKDTIDKKVIEEAKNNIARDIEFLNRAQNIFDKNPQYDETYWEEEKALAKLFNDGKVDENIKVGSDIYEAAELIVSLNVNGTNSNANQKTKSEQLKSFKEWSEIKLNWQDVSTMEGVRYDDISKTIEEKKKANWTLLSKLVSAGIFSQNGAEVFNAIYADRIYHRLRPMAATCYEPTILGAKQSSVRNDIENRLKELDRIAKEGKVNTEVIDQAKRNLEKDMEIILLINDLWDTGKSANRGDKYQEEEKKLLSYFVDEGWGKAEIKDNLNVRESIKETMEIIQLLYAD